jgi:hypothetical protein
MANQCGPARGSRMRQARPLDMKPALAVLKRSTTCTGVRAVGNSVPLFHSLSLSFSSRPSNASHQGRPQDARVVPDTAMELLAGCVWAMEPHAATCCCCYCTGVTYHRL